MKTACNNRPCLWLRLSLAILIASPTDGSHAQTHYQVGVGCTNILDTYLSQEKFHGVGVSLLTTRERPTAVGAGGTDRRWGSLWQHQMHLSSAKDRAGNASVMEAMYKLCYGRYLRIPIGDRIEIHAGALASAGLGFIYDTLGGNNPVQARLGIHVMPSAKGVCRFQMFRRAAALRYQLDLPLAGVVFSPNYGQSYYEMFSLGNYDHNIVPVTFASAPNFRQQIALLCRVHKSLTLSIGYLGDYQQQSVNNLKQHVYDHAFLVGVGRNL